MEQKESTFQCPLCLANLLLLPGSKMDSNDGVTLLCPSLSCPAQEVMGHGKNEKEAYSVVVQKFNRKSSK